MIFDFESFSTRHIGPDLAERDQMLKATEAKSLDALMEEAIPRRIRLPHKLRLPEGQSEYEFLRELRTLAAKNELFKSYLGLGYSDCITPSVILRNVLENPGWYTPYTPYQAEMAQGRLESLLNFQTVVRDLTGMEVANASLLDEATAAAEAMTMLHRVHQKSTSKFFVADSCFPQTIDVLRARAEPLGIELVIGDWRNADLTGAKIFGISAWKLNLEGATQKDLVISSPFDQTTTTVDDIEMGQFLYLLLDNRKIRRVIDNITTKVVLILGSFTPERKAILDAIREELRARNYLPVLFDFHGSDNRDLTETVSTLAHMAKFIIADLTDAKSLPQELMRIVPVLPSVPVQPILLSTEHEWGMYETFTRYPWVLPIVNYDCLDEAIESFKDKIIDLAEGKVLEQLRR